VALGRILKIIIILPVLYIGAVFVASEMGGEVITLATQREDGRPFETSVWVVDMDRTTWVRAGNPDSEWVARLQANPEVFMTRDGQKKTYRATVVAGLASRVNAAIREKYGIADQLISTIHDAEKVIAIRLDPQ
jgi:pyridoxine/pyridoxamine 5'-phosphate oxidase